MAEPLNATFFALRHRDRAVLAPATVVLIVLLLAIAGAYVATNWGAFSDIGALIQRGHAAKPTDAESLRLVSHIFPLIGTTFLFMFPMFIVIAAYEAACLRWMIRGEAPWLFGITFDSDTWRVYGVYWCWWILQMAVGFAMSMVMIPIMFMTMGDIMRGGQPDPEAMMRWQWTVQIPLSLLQYIPLAFLGIRFGPAAATSIIRKRFSFFEAWRVTRGRFLALLGSYVVLWAIAAIALIVLFGAMFGAVFGSFFVEFLKGGMIGNVAENEEMFRRVFSPQMIGVLIGGYAVNLLLMLIYAVMSYGVNARATMAALEEGTIEVDPA